MSKITIVEIPAEDSLCVWKNSPHATVFTHYFVLKKLAYKTHWFLARKGEEALCAWPVCLDEQGESYRPPFSYFVGPIWTFKGLNKPHHRQLSVRLAVYEGFLDVFEKHFGKVVASLAIGISDVRVFDWWNFHDTSKPRIQIFPRYTAQITPLSRLSKLELGYRDVRRQQIRKTERAKNFFVDESATSSQLFDFYSETLSKQGKSVGEVSEKHMSVLQQLISDGYGYLTAVKDLNSNGEVVFVTLTLRSAGTSNLILNLTNNAYRKTGVSVYGIHKSIERAALLGDHTYDFNGANSPNRADDKHSYGAEDRLYFDIVMN